ncbi:hypothetical protein EBU94_07365, partial [bacterium]|nr:hypothetical protein [bacterium]
AAFSSSPVLSSTYSSGIFENQILTTSAYLSVINFNGVLGSYFTMSQNSQTNYINSFDYDVMDYRKVIDIVDFEEGSTTGVNTLFTIEQTLAQQTYFSYAMGNYGFDLISWYTLKNWLEVREKLLAQKRSISFNDRTQYMQFYPPPRTPGSGSRFYGVVNCYVERPLRDLIKEQWVYQYALALSKISVGNVRGKYTGTTLFGGGQINYNDYTYLTYSHINKVPIAYGQESKEMLGRVPKGMEVIRPIQNTEINNNRFFEIYLKNVLSEFNKVDKSFRLKSKPNVYLPLPLDYTQSSMSNYKVSLEKSGAGEVIFLKKTPSSFYGLPRSKENKKAIMIMDIGYQKTEIGVVYRDDTISSKVINFGGESIDKYVMSRILEDRKIQCSQNNIEKYKEECLMFLPFNNETEKFKIVGKDVRKGSPASQELSFAELREYVIPMVRHELVKQTKAFFNTLTDHTIGDIFEEGMYIIGGTAKNYSLS